VRVLGLMSGTSHDGIDAAVVDFTLDSGVLVGAVTFTSETAYPAAVRARIVAALPPAAVTLAEVTELDTMIGQAFASVGADVIAAAGPCDLIVSHGQTVYHWVSGTTAFGTLQLGQPAWIAERTGTPVLADVRIRDITVGGHGAPLVSLLDSMLLRGLGDRPAALNLGGIANITVVGGEGLRAYDIGPANALIDAVVAAEGLDPRGYDHGGGIAARGTVDEALLTELLAEPYYRLEPPKSTGKELFNLDYVRSAAGRAGAALAPADLVSTLTELTVRIVGDAVRRENVDVLVISGGGIRNPVLAEGIRRRVPGVRIIASDDLGAPAGDKEAIAFALLGWCSWHGLPGTVAGGTGARVPRILGALIPGAGPLELPDPLPEMPSLRLTGPPGHDSVNV
jgi:anhydro-N-acetylmuramic acid kinase